MTTARVEAISSIVDRAVHHTSKQQQQHDDNNNTDASSTFGEHVFSTRVMESRLPSHVYHHILSCIKTRNNNNNNNNNYFIIIITILLYLSLLSSSSYLSSFRFYDSSRDS